ncbi:MAG: hypothetical protein EAX90_11065 [Candidatus Heimdallarchaeota archaeon]|nr:hypothetical protein [Candidatus Heimdallarchaeota archaeon]
MISMNYELANKRLKIASLLLTIFTSLMVITYIFLLFRRFLLITDAILEGYGSGGFLNRDELLTNSDLLATFTKIFDSLQVIALCGIVIAFILILISSQNQHRKYLIVLVVNFSVMIILRLIRVILIHQGPEYFILIGNAYTDVETYYEFAFFIYSTDIMRLVITILLIISVILFNRYLQKINNFKKNLGYTTPIILGIFLVFYVIIVILGAVLYTKINYKIDIALYYLNYTVLSLIQIGNIIVYLSLGKIGRSILSKDSKEV